MDRTHTDTGWMDYGRKLWKFAGSYGLGIALMLILLVLTFAGTLHQVRLSSSMGTEAAIESFFGAPYVLIPLGGEHSLLSLPLPGMGITCTLLFINLLIGGMFRVRWSWKHAGILVAHGGILLLLAGIMLGNKMTVAVDQVELPQGDRVHEQSLPFDLRLNRFVPEFYPGTSKPKSYESQVTVFPESGGQYDAVIRMNEPLRLSGWTLYQMSWGQDALHPGRLISILRASHNPLEQMPKWSSYIIAVGLLWHFGLVFGRYLRRKPGQVPAETEAVKGQLKEPEEPPVPGGKRRLRLIGVCVLVAAIFGIGMLAARPAAHLVEVRNYVPWSSFLVERAGGMAVQDGGRLKPVSTYAGFHLLRTLGKRSFSIHTPEGKKKITPVEWMLDCMFRPELAEQYPVFLVNREEVVTQLHLPDQADKRKKYSYAQIAEHWQEMTRAVREIRMLGEGNLTEAQKEILALSRNFDVVRGWMLGSRIMLEDPSAMGRMEFPQWFPSVQRNGEHSWTAVPDKSTGAFLAMASLLERKALGMEGKEADGLRMKAEGLLLEKLAEPNEAASAGERHSLEREIFYYRLDPLYLSLAVFVAAFVCLLLCALFRPSASAPLWRRFLRPGGFSLAWLLGAAGTGVLVAALAIRVMITMRSPVGNTYETIAFIACMGVLCALVAELFSKKGIVLAAGLLLGALSCQMGILYESSQAVDHMDPLVAILRSNFLLSTHVITIVLGYAAGLLAAVLSHVYLLAVPLRLIGRKTEQSLDRMAYGILCFSLVFTLVGTVFGGIWGNESWGRFWGWDPKENGALMIVLWQLIMLHARKAGWLSPWRLHFGNVVGGVIIAFAWWGVNMLGVGLHSYGFTSGRDALDVFYWSEAVLCVLFIILHCRALRRVEIR